MQKILIIKNAGSLSTLVYLFLFKRNNRTQKQLYKQLINIHSKLIKIRTFQTFKNVIKTSPTYSIVLSAMHQNSIGSQSNPHSKDGASGSILTQSVMYNSYHVQVNDLFLTHIRRNWPDKDRIYHKTCISTILAGDSLILE